MEGWIKVENTADWLVAYHSPDGTQWVGIIKPQVKGSALLEVQRWDSLPDYSYSKTLVFSSTSQHRAREQLVLAVEAAIKKNEKLG
jgi:hypothetical protein